MYGDFVYALMSHGCCWAIYLTVMVVAPRIKDLKGFPEILESRKFLYIFLYFLLTLDVPKENYETVFGLIQLICC